LEAMNEVLSKVDKTIVSGEVGGKTLPLLPMREGRRMAQPSIQQGGSQ
ncbi:MAG: HflK protein, partial [Gammaproteobacteria bacterium]|nr:HflK protein [Gammaproteobacteria bacterium]